MTDTKISTIDAQARHRPNVAIPLYIRYFEFHHVATCRHNVQTTYIKAFMKWFNVNIKRNGYTILL